MHVCIHSLKATRQGGEEARGVLVVPIMYATCTWRHLHALTVHAFASFALPPLSNPLPLCCLVSTCIHSESQSVTALLACSLAMVGRLTMATHKNNKKFPLHAACSPGPTLRLCACCVLFSVTFNLHWCSCERAYSLSLKSTHYPLRCV